MTALPAPKVQSPPRRRLSPAERERDIVAGAVAFFAEHGFDGATRDLARRLGITQPLLYRYFPGKDALLDRVYQEVLGDAAFVARPHVGMGVTKAAADAAALVSALDDGSDVEAALAAFEARRLSFGRAVVQRARHLGAYMQAQILDADERARAERHRRPEAVMSETAVATGIAA
ncbi:TetR family transcriptional regulator [Xanthobacter autotrophicus]